MRIATRSLLAVMTAIGFSLVPFLPVPRVEPVDGPYPESLGLAWNRAHSALFNESNGRGLRGDPLDPLVASAEDLLAQPRRAQLTEAIGELLAGELESAPALARAIMQRDLRAMHEQLVPLGNRNTDAAGLRDLVARAVRSVALSAAEVQELDALLRIRFAESSPWMAELLDDASTGPWVQLAPPVGDPQGVAPVHETLFGQRAQFTVHMRQPGGRTATETYLRELFAQQLTREHQGQMRLRPDLPQPPAGTEVALVRRSLHVDRDGKVHALALIELVQLRALVQTEPPQPDPHDGARSERSFWEPYHAVRELELDRAGLLRGGVGLREIGSDEPDLASLGGHHGRLDDLTKLPRRLSTCMHCHGATGVHSLVSFTGLMSGPGTQLDATPQRTPRVLTPAKSARDDRGSPRPRNKETGLIQFAFVLLKNRGSQKAQLPEVPALLGSLTRRIPGTAFDAEPPDKPGQEEDVLLIRFKGGRVIVALMGKAVPGGEADRAFQFSPASWSASFRPPVHDSHLIVSLLFNEQQPPVEAQRMFTSVLASVMESTKAVGVYWGQASVSHPSGFFLDLANGDPELWIMLWTGVSRVRPAPGRLSLLSLGMSQFGIMDLMVTGPTSMGQDLVMNFFQMLEYAIQRGEAIPDGDTVGSSGSERLRVTHEPSPIDASEKIWRIDYR